MRETLDSILRGTKTAANATYTALRDYRSTKKIKLDKILDPILMTAGSNLGYIVASDYALDQISKNIETYEGLAMMGGYTLLTGGLYGLNRHVLPKINRKIKEIHQKKLNKRKQATSLSWLKTLALTGLLTVSSMSQTTIEAFKNIRYDGQRITNAFSRETKLPPENYTPYIEEPTTPLSTAPIKNGKKCLTGELEGVKLGGLATQYTGINGRAPKEVTVDFNAQLDKLWKNKLAKSDNPVVRQTYNSQVQKYFQSNHTLMTIDDYIQNEIAPTLKDVKNNLDWNSIKKSKKMNTEQLTLLRHITDSISPKDLMAYSLTELMPTLDGQVNVALFDFMLRNGGKEYVELIPAIYDKLTSFGPYQFTSFALYDHNGEKRGASVINEALPPKKRIPGSVMLLEGTDHHKAAYLFAIDNIANMITRLNRSQIGTLKEVGPSKKEDIIQFIATAHNKPGHAYDAAKRWLDNRAKSDYTQSCGNGIRVYSQKTGINYNALMKQTS